MNALTNEFPDVERYFQIESMVRFQPEYKNRSTIFAVRHAAIMNWSSKNQTVAYASLKEARYRKINISEIFGRRFPAAHDA
jgi:hypothetical protein